MNITVNIDDEVAEKVRKIAADKNTTLTAMVRDYLTSVANAESPAPGATQEEADDEVRAIVTSLVGRDAASGTAAGRESAAKN